MATATTTLEQIWEAAGGNPAKAKIAAAVALAESGGNPNSTNVNSNGTIDRGLWQINSIHGPLSTFDPSANARAAVQISGNGTNWAPWCTAWGDGACGTRGGDPPGPGTVAPDSPAAKYLSGAATATVKGGAGTTAGSSGAASSIGTQGWGGLVIGVVQMLAGGALLLIGIVLAAKMAADSAGLSLNPSEIPVIGAKAKQTRAKRATEAVELENRRRISYAKAAEAESRATAASSRAVTAQRGPRTTVHSPGVRPYRPKLGTPAAQVRAERARRGLAVEDDSNPTF